MHLSSYTTRQRYPAAASPVMSNSPLRIFDIPHVMETIGAHLSTVDIWTFRRVSSSWNTTLEPLRFRKVEFLDLTPPQMKIILKNARRIRTLTAELVGAQHILEGLYDLSRSTTVPRYLKELNCVSHDPECRPWDFEDPLYVDASLNALTLVDVNPNLERLRIACNWWQCTDPRQAPIFSDEILESISRHPTLTCIQLELFDFFHHDALLSFLLHCPKTLEDLEVVVDELDAYERTSELLPAAHGLAFASMRRLCLRGNWCGCENILFPLIRSSPQLREFVAPLVEDSHVDGMMDVLRLHCKDLRKLTLDRQDYDVEDSGPAWGRGVMDFFGASHTDGPHSCLAELWMENCPKLSHAVVDALPYPSGRSPGSRLQILHLRNDSDVSTPRLARIVFCCPNLKKLVVQYNKGVCLRALVEQDWVCIKLSDLDLDIDASSSGTEAQRDVFELIRRLHHKLRSLESLRSPIVRWKPISWFHSSTSENALGFMNDEDSREAGNRSTSGSGSSGQLSSQRVRITKADLVWIGLLPGMFSNLARIGCDDAGYHDLGSADDCAKQ